MNFMKRALCMLLLFLLLHSYGEIRAIQSGAPQENILYVGGSGPNNYTELQDAINASVSGEKIIVFAGTYGGATVNVSLLYLEGRGAITGAIKINANSVTLDGFIIKDSYHAVTIDGNYNEIKNCNILNSSYGIKINGYYDKISHTLKGTHNKIHQNKIFNNGYYGIWIDHGENNDITQNEIYRNEIGIYLQKSHEHLVAYNTIRNNDIGVKIQGGENNMVKRNSIVDNDKRGIYFCCHSHNNTVYENNFIGNDLHAYCYSGENLWDFGGHGNYWDDYDGGGVYVIYGENIDHHPSSTPYDVSEPSYEIYITAPKKNEEISGKYTVMGLSEKEGKVEIKIDDGPWMEAYGTFSWSVEIDTTALSNGEHTIYARCGSSSSSVAVYVNNAENEQNTPSFTWYALVLSLGMAIGYHRYRKRRHS